MVEKYGTKYYSFEVDENTLRDMQMLIEAKLQKYRQKKRHTQGETLEYFHWLIVKEDFAKQFRAQTEAKEA